ETRVGSLVTIDEDVFLKRLARTHSPEEVETAHQIFAWATQNKGIDNWTTTGIYMPRFSYKGVDYNLIALTATGKLSIRFGFLRYRPGPLRLRAERLQLCRQLNAIPGVTVASGMEDKFPSIPLKRFSDEPQREALFEFLTTLIGKVREA
ncbi:MAG: hypothetical protein JNL09_04215, partial [Anaerolineales bacterium]|nr:hypothetical protein [Anaerolineales bacterium]